VDKRIVNSGVQRDATKLGLSTNSRGPRGPELALGDRDAGAQILFVGDSFTEGYGVDDGDEFPQLVGRQLSNQAVRAEIVNEGIGDTGTGRALRLVRAYVAKAPRTSALVYQFSMNDFDDNVRDGFFHLDSNGSLVESPTPVPISFLRKVQPVIDSIPGLSQSHFLAALVQVARSVGRPTRQDPAPLAASSGNREVLTLRLVTEIIATARRAGWHVVVIVADAPAAVAERIGEVARAGSAAFVAIPPKSQRPDLYYRIDGHWNRAGHAEAAARVGGPIATALAEVGSR
jgi:lysophospholipase L1-like esterase